MTPTVSHAVAIFDTGDPMIYRMTDGYALVLITKACCLRVPFDWTASPAEEIAPCPAQIEKAVATWLALPPAGGLTRASITFGELLRWTSKRMPTEEFLADDVGTGMERPRRDWQPCGPQFIDRWLLREMMQWFVEADAPSATRLEMAWTKTEHGPCLRLRAGQTNGFQMALRDGDGAGADHPPCQWSRFKTSPADDDDA